MRRMEMDSNMDKVENGGRKLSEIRENPAIMVDFVEQTW